MSVASFAAAVFVFLLAGTVKGVIGMGLPTVAIALLGAFMPPGQAAALMVVPSLITNFWQGVAGEHLLPLLRRLWVMLIGICVGTAVAASGAFRLEDPRHATVALGVALMGYAAYGALVKTPCLTRRAERAASPAVGLLNGMVSGLTGVLVMPSVPFLQALNLARDELIQALGITFTVATVALAVALADAGHLDAGSAGASAALLVPSLLGMALGQRVRSRVSPAAFRACFFAGTFLVGAHLVLKTVFT